ncbi:MAG: hypothetical protein P8103_11495 [Candidatus Thiodiazotropha sp.]
MLPLKQHHHAIVAPLLALLMLATRGHHDFTPVHLPDASWAIFFLAGLYLPWRSAFIALFLLAAGMDYVAITWGGVSSFCVTNAYLFLVPAYAVLWFAGRSYRNHSELGRRDLIPLTLLALVGTLGCELISSGGFYFFSGRFVEPTLGEFAGRLAQYLPANLRVVALYLGLAAVVHAIFSLARGKWGRAGASVG